MAVSEKDRGLIEDYREALLSLANWLDGFGTIYHGDRAVVKAANKLRRLEPADRSGLTYLMTHTMVYVDEVVESLYADDPLYPRMVQDWEEEEDDVRREIHRLSVILPGLGFAAPYAATEAEYRPYVADAEASGLSAEEKLRDGLERLALTGTHCGSKTVYNRHGRLGVSLCLKINGDYPNKEEVVSEAIDQAFEEFGVQMPNPYEITDRERWVPQELARISRLAGALWESTLLPY